MFALVCVLFTIKTKNCCRRRKQNTKVVVGFCVIYLLTYYCVHTVDIVPGHAMDIGVDIGGCPIDDFIRFELPSNNLML